MIKLINDLKREFCILNLTDPQLANEEWAEGNEAGRIFRKTAETLIKRVAPDLITISGDLSYAGNFESYKNYAEYFDSFQIPWTCCFGNHDNQGGDGFVRQVIDEYMKHEFFVFEKCDIALGNSNFVILIEQNGKNTEGIILMDTHDRLNEHWAKLMPNQLAWYEESIKELKELGCNDTLLITHIPIHAYVDAAKAAFKNPTPDATITIRDSYGDNIWNAGYEESFGVFHEPISTYPEDEGAFEVIRRLDSTKTILCGHDHVNNWVVTYEGVRFVFATKTGSGCYWEPEINGGTVITINETGVSTVRHEYVDV